MRTSQRKINRRSATQFHVANRVICQFTPTEQRIVVAALREAGELRLAGYVARRTVV